MVIVTTVVAVVLLRIRPVVAVVTTVILLMAVVAAVAVVAVVAALVGRRPGHRPNLRSRRELSTTDTDEKAIAAPAIVGDRNPRAATGIARTL